MADKLDVLLYGLGAIGSFYAFILHRTNRVRLTVVARSNYTAVKENGILLKSANHGDHHFHPDRVIHSPSELTHPPSYIICTNKAIDTANIIHSLAPAINQNTTIVIIQNGVGNEDPFRAAYPTSTIISCVTWVGASQPTPGVTIHTTSEETELGLYPNPTNSPSTESTRLTTFTSLLAQGQTPYTIHEDIQPTRWGKVIWNCAWNTLTTLTGQDTQAFLQSSEDAIPLTRRLMGEVLGVARASGVSLPDGLIDTQIARIQGLGAVRTSMQVDRENGRAMEIEVIVGTVVRKAREVGVETPVLDTLYVLLRAVDGGRKKGEEEGKI
ncbi:ketopantoate reductase family protein [Aspergillus sclerotioniger CBS 115572]|uniref:2-dehydropantoate 2-reductase n=1 Tax=Aspergillus sclerotioniger CBS 115572 TaxID=1450535 RepID=A0A317WTB7_9EURO|nr:ketopantoate reductase family protein [Aspergillus sclerotioniger CBS 115572]PWY89653.1 ketopantoate reductase family protein [Aspergillus sclerotioniger CBS 115572]